MSFQENFHATGVLLMAHGTPSDPGEIENFYTRIRRGRPPSEEQLADLVRRYQAIGGTSPLAEVTTAQARAMRLALGLRMPVAVGNRFTSPAIEEGVASLKESGADVIVAVVLSPQFSLLTTAEYFRRAREAAADASLRVIAVESWHLDPALIAFHTRHLEEELERGPAHVLFTAHSLPVTSTEHVDPYRGQVAETASAVATAAGIADGRWSIAWQSAGRTEEKWLSPDLLCEIEKLGASGFSRVVVCPVGFSSENMETLYDLDIEAAGVAARVGVEMSRTPLPGADAGLFFSLAQRIVEAATATEPEATRRRLAVRPVDPKP